MAGRLTGMGRCWMPRSTHMEERWRRCLCLDARARMVGRVVPVRRQGPRFWVRGFASSIRRDWPVVPASWRRPRLGVRGFALGGVADLAVRTCFKAKAPIWSPGLCFFGTAGEAVRTCTWYGGSHRSYLLRSKSPGFRAGALLLRYDGRGCSYLYLVRRVSPVVPASKQKHRSWGRGFASSVRRVSPVVPVLGAGNRNRTYDLRITNAPLYQLSYSGLGRAF